MKRRTVNGTPKPPRARTVPRPTWRTAPKLTKSAKRLAGTALVRRRHPTPATGPHHEAPPAPAALCPSQTSPPPSTAQAQRHKASYSETQLEILGLRHSK